MVLTNMVLSNHVLDKHGLYKHDLYMLLISFWNNLPAVLDLTLNLVYSIATSFWRTDFNCMDSTFCFWRTHVFTARRVLENSTKLFKTGQKIVKKGPKNPDTYLFFTYLPPVAKSVFEGFISIAWIPHSASGGLLFSLLASEGMWSTCRVLTSKTINLLHFVPKTTCLCDNHLEQNILSIFGITIKERNKQSKYHVSQQWCPSRNRPETGESPKT